VIARTAARRTAVAGLVGVAALVLSAPASAVDVGGAVEQLAPGVTKQADGTFRNAAGQLVDAAGNLLPVPLPPTPPLPAPVGPAVEQVKEVVAPTPPPSDQPPAQEETATPPPADKQAGTTTTAAAAAPGTGAPPAAAAPAPAGTVTATSIGGTGFAAAPTSIGALDRAGFGVGSGTAANPMSLFGAPQVALPPTLGAPAIAAPQVFSPAGTAVNDLIPVGAPESVPGYLTALACAVVAGAAGAHVAALRSRRAGAPATA
jgi:hypothetical protein